MNDKVRFAPAPQIAWITFVVVITLALVLAPRRHLYACARRSHQASGQSDEDRLIYIGKARRASHRK